MNEVIRTIYCDEFIKAFGIDKPCCSSCHDEADEEDELNVDYGAVINSGYDLIRLPSGEHVKAQLCCVMHSTKEFKEAEIERI